MTLFGDEVAVGVYDDGGITEIDARTRAANPATSLEVAERVLAAVETSLAGSGPLDPTLCASHYEQAVGQGVLDPAALSQEQFCAVPEEFPPPLEPVELGELAQLDDGISFQTKPEVLRKLRDKGRLGDSAMFRRAVPRHEDRNRRVR